MLWLCRPLPIGCFHTHLLAKVSLLFQFYTGTWIPLFLQCLIESMDFYHPFLSGLDPVVKKKRLTSGVEALDADGYDDQKNPAGQREPLSACHSSHIWGFSSHCDLDIHRLPRTSPDLLKQPQHQVAINWWPTLICESCNSKDIKKILKPIPHDLIFLY